MLEVKTTRNDNGINGANELLSNTNDLLSLGLGVSLSEREIDIRNNILLKNWHRTNYGIDSISLSSQKYHIEPTGVVAGTSMVGENIDAYSSEGRKGLSVESYGGIIGYTKDQEDSDIDKKNVKDAMFKTGIVNNKVFKQGASFINPSNFDEYNIDEKKHSLYTTSSINATASTNTVKGAYKYNGGNEDLISRRTQNNTDVKNDYIIYNEDARGNLTNTRHILDSDDTSSFMTDDSYSSSSLLLGEYEDTVKPRTLVMRTNELFRNGKIGSLVARFKTGSDFGATNWPSSKTSQHGMSRGRNLLKGSTEKINGYDNPYCRVWTNHYQYSKHNNLIRPFVDGEWTDGINGSKLRENLGGLNAHIGCDPKNEQLAKYSVLEDNGHVKITPYVNESNGKYSDTRSDKSLKRYMFSIENLAWKGYTDGLSPEQKGPNGGRIMWFPPYDLKFHETTKADWTPHKFIGRGEQIYTYSNTDRSGNIDFCILVDHPSTVDIFVNQNKEETEKNEQTLLRYFAGCDYDIIEPIEPEPIEVPCGDDGEINKNPEEEERLKYVEVPEAIHIIFPVFFQNNFTGINYLDPQKYDGMTFKYSNDDNKYKFGEYKHHSNTCNVYKCQDGQDAVITEPYFVGRSVSDAEKILMETEWYTLSYAGNESGIGEINKKSYDNSINLKERHDFESNNKSTLLSEEDCAKIMDSNLESGIGSDIFESGKRHVYAQDVKRFSRERQPSNCYECVTFGLNTSLFSKYYNSSKENKPISEESVDYDRVETAYNGAYSLVKSVALNSDAISVSLEELQNINSISDLFKVIGAEYTTSAVTNTGEVIEISWEVEALNAFGGASSAGQNNTSLATFRYLFLNELLNKHNIPVKLDTSLIKTGVQSNENGYTSNKGSKDSFGVNFTNSYPLQKAFRFGAIYLKLYPVVHCGGSRGDVGVSSMDNISQSLKYKDEKTKKEYLICAREVVKSGSPSASKYKNEKICYSGCTFKHSAHDEYEYFKKIKTTDPVLFKNLVKKFQYFDPAFHSITPEGFNSRLTFLQQCTRQGPTNSTSDSGIVSTIGAGNLAFGAPPYCIIRIGDFFHTKVKIDSINITYDGAGGISWDLNPEGIGVQPMYAKVQMQVTFLGGSDLAAPVSRLQNAISSNYYANASVYDNTALKDSSEQVEYDLSRGKIQSKMYDLNEGDK